MWWAEVAFCNQSSNTKMRPAFFLQNDQACNCRTKRTHYTLTKVLQWKNAILTHFLINGKVIEYYCTDSTLWKPPPPPSQMQIPLYAGFGSGHKNNTSTISHNTATRPKNKPESCLALNVQLLFPLCQSSVVLTLQQLVRPLFVVSL